MIRFLNIASVLALLACALYAYQVKYETIFYVEQLVKMRHAIDAENDAIGMLQAEWTLLTRPERIQALANIHLDLKQLSLDQIVKPNDLPVKAEKYDAIGRELDSLGLGRPTNTPIDDTATNTTTPAPPRPVVRSASPKPVH